MEKIQCRNLPLENFHVAFVVGGSYLMSGKKPAAILNAEENTIEDYVRNGTKKNKEYFQSNDLNKKLEKVGNPHLKQVLHKLLHKRFPYLHAGFGQFFHVT